MKRIFALAMLAVPTSHIPLACTTAAAQEGKGDVVHLDQAWSQAIGRCTTRHRKAPVSSRTTSS